MLNLKISLILLAAVLSMTVGGLYVSNDYIGQVLEADTLRDLTVARETVARSKALDAYGQLAAAERVGAWPNFAEKLLRPYAEGIEGLDERHQAIWEELNVWVAKLKAERKGKASSGLEDARSLTPDELLVVDASGAVVARFTDYAWWGNQVATELPVVLEVGKSGRAQRDLWNSEHAGMLEVTVAPIFGVRPAPPGELGERLFLGSVILGFKMSEQGAERLKGLTGADVVFFFGDKVSAGTLRGEELTALQSLVRPEGEVKGSLSRVEAGSVQELQGRPYRLMPGFFTGYSSSASAGFVLLIDQAARRAALGTLNTAIPLAGLLVFLLLWVLTSVSIRSFVRPFEELDHGIHEFINGNSEYTFPTSDRETLAGNMAHSLNLMAAILQGKTILDDDESMPGAEGAANGGWKDPLFIDEVSQVRKRPEMAALPGLRPPPKKEPQPAPPEPDLVEAAPERIEPGTATQELISIPEQLYHKRLFDEYVATRKTNGESLAGVEFDKFQKKVLESAETLRKQLGCRLVRFRVDSKDGRTTLKPIPMD